MYTFQQAADAARTCMQEIVERGNALILPAAVSMYPRADVNFIRKFLNMA